MTVFKCLFSKYVAFIVNSQSQDDVLGSCEITDKREHVFFLLAIGMFAWEVTKKHSWEEQLSSSAPEGRFPAMPHIQILVWI